MSDLNSTRAVKNRKVHCRGSVEHFNRPVCGAALDNDVCVSRFEFRLVALDHRCKSCAASRWARFI